jgi:hypothetical protein
MRTRSNSATLRCSRFALHMPACSCVGFQRLPCNTTGSALARNGFGPEWLWPGMALARNGFGPEWLWPGMALARNGSSKLGSAGFLVHWTNHTGIADSTSTSGDPFGIPLSITDQYLSALHQTSTTSRYSWTPLKTPSRAVECPAARQAAGRCGPAGARHAGFGLLRAPSRLGPLRILLHCSNLR